MGDGDKVHLRTVLAHLQEQGHWEGRSVTDLRARLTLLGIPHDRAVKVSGVPTWGVRRKDLVTLSPATRQDSQAEPSTGV